MNLKRTRLNILRAPANFASKARTGVSLHCHTEHSKEMLDFVPHYAEKLPIIAQFWRRERDRYKEREGRGLDFTTAYWTPPLTAKDVFSLEREQINGTGLNALVSLSDHDSISANLILHKEGFKEAAPISLEWTVPFEYGFFHVGVHNLPAESAGQITETLLGYTFDEESHSNERLTEMFAMLNDLPGVLVILNHPLWDIEMVGKEKHEVLLKRFIREHGRWIHAFEINGFRTWSENKAVIEMAEALDIPIVTGGDRHGCKPNTVINLSNSETFDGFVEEIRVDKRSEVVLMPEYRQPIHSRQLQSFAEILRHYPDYPDGRKQWFERIFIDVGDEKGLVSLSGHGWKRGGPTWLRAAIWVLGVMGSPPARPFFAIARRRRDRVPKDLTKTQFDIPEVEGILGELSSETA